MTQDIFEEVGKKMPYQMPQTLNFEAMMDKAIATEKTAEKKKSKFVLLRWISASAVSAAAVAVIVLVFTFTSSPAVADPSTEYHAAIESFCNNASNEQMEMHMDMAAIDVVNNMDDYQEYFN